jgi:hypothetical protein
MSASPEDSARVEAPTARPGFPKTGSVLEGHGYFDLGLRAGARCAGVACLGESRPRGGRRFVQAYRDGRCAKEDVRTTTRTIHVAGTRNVPERTLEKVEHACDPALPARQTSTLLVETEAGPRTLRLPASCADAALVGSDRAAFAVCSSKHQGTPAFLRVTRDATLVPTPAAVPASLTIEGTDVASDGTTVLLAHDAAWLCGAAPGAACAVVPGPDLLTARALPGGRALVARRGAQADDLVLELLGEPGATPLHVHVNGNALALSITAEGNVRLWTSRSWRKLGSPHEPALHPPRKGPYDLAAWRVRADGALQPDEPAKEAWVQELEAARARVR